MPARTRSALTPFALIRRGLTRCGLLLLLAVPLAVACNREEKRLPTPAELAETTWDQYREDPGPNSYVGFIAANRKAALDHGHPHDSLGVRYRVRAIEAQSEHAVRQEDLALAQDVIAEVDHIDADGVIEVFEEVFPLATERLRAARERVRPLLELPTDGAE